MQLHSGAVPGLDAAAVAGVHDALRRGQQAGSRWAHPRELGIARRIESAFPKTGDHVRAADGFHRRAAEWGVRHGANSVIFAACGWPAEPPVHAMAAQEAPGAWYAYADADAAIVAANRAVCGTAAFWASARNPARLLEAAREAGMPDGPVQVQVHSAAHWWPPEFAAWAVAEYARLLPSGSSLVLSLGILRPGPAADRFAALFSEAAGVPACLHTAGDIAAWIGRAGLVLHPWGVLDVRADGDGRSWADPELARGSPGRVVGAVAVKPLPAGG